MEQCAPGVVIVTVADRVGKPTNCCGATLAAVAGGGADIGIGRGTLLGAAWGRFAKALASSPLCKAAVTISATKGLRVAALRAIGLEANCCCRCCADPEAGGISGFAVGCAAWVAVAGAPERPEHAGLAFARLGAIPWVTFGAVILGEAARIGQGLGCAASEAGCAASEAVASALLCAGCVAVWAAIAASAAHRFSKHLVMTSYWEPFGNAPCLS